MLNQRLIKLLMSEHDTDQLQTIIKYASDAVHILDRDGNLVLFSDTFAQSLGYTNEEAASLNIMQWDAEIPKNELMERIRSLMHGSMIFETHHRRKDGSIFNVEVNVTGVSVRGELYLYASARDITQRKAMENALQQSEENYRELFEGVKEIKLVIDPRNGNIISANDAASQFYGYTSAQLCTMKISDINTLSPKEIEAEMVSAQSENRTHFYFKHRLANGEIRDVEVHSGPVVYNGKKSLYSIIHDITDRMRAERELELERSRLNVLIESIPDLIWFKDPDGFYLHCNSRFENFFGAKQSEILGKTDYDFVEKPLADFFRRNDLKAIEAGKPRINEEKVTFALDGHQEYLETIKTVVKDEKGTLIGVLGIGRDITLRKAHEEKMQLFANIYSSTHDGIIVCDANEKILDVNPAFTEIVGYSRSEVLGRTPRFLSSGRQSKKFYTQMWQQIKNEGFWKGEVWNRNKNGEFYAVQINISVIKNAESAISHYVGIFSDITSLKTHEEALDYMAHYDALTSLPNRTLLGDRLSMAISRAKRKRSLMAVCFIDLDGFKPINDLYGHKAGDNVLISIAQRLKDEVRGDDTVARIGGDEFVVLLNDLDSIHNLEDILNRFLESVKSPYIIAQNSVQVSASIGVALTSSGDIEADILLRRADQAMYLAKQMGRDQYHIFDVERDESIKEHHDMLKEMQKGLNNGEFELYYQPKVNMLSGEVFAAEGLIRWNHPEKGLLSPAIFLPALKGHPLGITFDYWAINQAMGQCLQWYEQGCMIIVSVNITGETLLNPNFIQELRLLVSKFPDFKPEYLTFEVLETAMLEDITHAKSIFNQCLDMGFRLSLDDFGTGYSSLTYLRHFPIHNVKIDQSFVKDILTEDEDLSLVESIIGLSKVFHKAVIAEGVESEAIGCKLIEMGCFFAQGYAIARPMKRDAILPWIRQYQPFASWKKAIVGV